MRRATILVVVVAMLLTAMAAPAAATKPDPGSDLEDGHKITICHATRSLSNPYVEITIDIAAWNDPSDDRNHGDHHTRTKDGVTWKDYILEEGQECTLPPPPPTLFCDDLPVDFKVEFSGGLLVSDIAPSGWGYPQTETVGGLEIPAGTYDLILGASDNRGADLSEIQDNEKWFAVFSDGSKSTYSEELPDGVSSPFTVTDGGSVVFQTTITSVTATHWDLDDGNVSTQYDSVIPEYVCLIEVDNS